MDIKAIPVVTAGAYSASDAVGGLLTFGGATRHSGGSGLVIAAKVIDTGNVKANLVLWLFSKSVSVAADNDAFAISTADMAYCVGCINIGTTDYLGSATNAVANPANNGIITYTLAGTSLYGQLQCVATPTYGSTSDLVVVVSIEYLGD